MCVVRLFRTPRNTAGPSPTELKSFPDAMRPRAAVLLHWGLAAGVDHGCFPWACIDLCKNDPSCEGIVTVSYGCTFRSSIADCAMIPKNALDGYVAYDFRALRTLRALHDGQGQVEYYPNADIACRDYAVNGHSFVGFRAPRGCMAQMRDAYAEVDEMYHGGPLTISLDADAGPTAAKYALVLVFFGFCLFSFGLVAGDVVALPGSPCNRPVVSAADCDARIVLDQVLRPACHGWYGMHNDCVCACTSAPGTPGETR